MTKIHKIIIIKSSGKIPFYSVGKLMGGGQRAYWKTSNPYLYKKDAIKKAKEWGLK